ncbi:type II secretion system protein [Clostridium sp. DSM 100503]|uniref:type IV pilin protein n=1 Tax=Clostridium sp. DSM 100503 TaxID=2963282 RepID=UPI00214A2722|nr:type II secretion system protein [Clostridium sp. DSM 100503]MCR1950549.1 type II secretion system protein [Clostridium sp. DSM 100503]
MEGNMNRKRKGKFTIFDLIAVVVIIGILVAILVPSFKKYSIDSKKAEVKSIMREFVLAVETTEISDKVEFSNTDSIKTIEANNKEKLDSINKYINNPEDLNKIKDLTIEEANQIINNELDFEINKDGQFLRVIKEN